ncbi:hypothetical protein OAA60_00935 [Porticoccaceae bacterium]|nr:hypothetical protein [Porticoccaceae bacterium]
MNITIELTETEELALAYAALSPQDWAENAVHNRCRIAIDEIVQVVMTKCLAEGEQIPTTREAIVAHGFECGVIQSAIDRQVENDATNKVIPI